MKDKILVADIIRKKDKGEKIAMLTAYDAGFASLLDKAGVDILLVGDSLGMVVLGYESTVPVTMDEMLHHAKAVKRGSKHALLVGDMPFLSYQTDSIEAVRNAGRFMKEAGCDAVKLEGGQEVSETVRVIVKAGIPVMGHIGLTPQTAGQLGGYTVQGKDLASARVLLAAARSLVEAGVFALVLECIPDQLGRIITAEIPIPTIGIGAGSFCDGQVLVTHDLVGLFEKFRPRFVKQYTNLAPRIEEAVGRFLQEMRAGEFPDEEHSFPSQNNLQELLLSED